MHSEPLADAASDAASATRTARQLEMLAELAEIGLELARAVAEHTKAQIAAAADGWAAHIPNDPGAAFSKLAQSVRRTIALEVCLREGSGGAGGRLFAPPGRPIDLNPAMPPTIGQPPDRPAGALTAAAAVDAAPPPDTAPVDTVPHDLGRLLDEPERFFERPVGPPARIAAGLCEAVGLDPARLAWKDERWVVRADPDDPSRPGDTPLRNWRPPFPPAVLAAPIPVPLE